MNKKPVYITHEIEDENTGAVAMAHVIEFYSVDLKYKVITATVNGYVSKNAYEKGKQALCAHTLTINGLPENVTDITLDWLYTQAVLPESSSVFAGAELNNF